VTSKIPLRLRQNRIPVYQLGLLTQCLRDSTMADIWWNSKKHHQIAKLELTSLGKMPKGSSAVFQPSKD